MAYDPADLKLPSWLLRFLDLLIAIRIPLGWGWRLGFTRPGIILFSALIGLWAAALYSGNNLLYLSGAMITAMSLAAIVQTRRILKYFPDPAALLPLLQQNSVTVVRREAELLIPAAAVVDINWHYGDGVFALSGRCEAGRLRLQGRIKAERRGLYRCQSLTLKSAAPLGLFQLELQRGDRGEVVVMPEPLSWQMDGQSVHADSGQQRIGGDEWHDLRLYTPGDALAQVHWRKASGDISDWRVKRFALDAQEAPESILRVDLRMPAHADDAAFEALLGRVWFWVLAQGENGTLILGQQRFELAEAMRSGALQRAIAGATSETDPAAGVDGLLLAVSDDR